MIKPVKSFDEAFYEVIEDFDSIFFTASHGHETLHTILDQAKQFIEAKSGLAPNLVLYAPSVWSWVKHSVMWLRQQRVTVLCEPRLGTDEMVITHRCHDMGFLALNEDGKTYSLVQGPMPGKYGVRIGDAYPEGTLPGW